MGQLHPPKRWGPAGGGAFVFVSVCMCVWISHEGGRRKCFALHVSCRAPARRPTLTAYVVAGTRSRSSHQRLHQRTHPHAPRGLHSLAPSPPPHRILSPLCPQTAPLGNPTSTAPKEDCAPCLTCIVSPLCPCL